MTGAMLLTSAFGMLAPIPSEVFVPKTSAPDRVSGVFFAQTRPVTIEITVDIDGAPLVDGWHAYLDKLFQYFDRDKNNKLDQSELDLANPKEIMSQALRGQFIYRRIGQKGIPLEHADFDRNGSVDRTEFHGYYRGNAFEMLRFQPTNGSDPTGGVLTTAIFDRLDTNKDRRLTQDELAAAEFKFRSLDGDEDECISFMEVYTPTTRTLSANPVAMVLPAGYEDTPVAAQPKNLSLFDGPLPAAVIADLLTKYDANSDRRLSRSESGFDVDLFRRFDADEDGYLTEAELETWRRQPADLRLHVRLPKSKTSAVVTGNYDRLPDGIARVPAENADSPVSLKVGDQLIDVAARVTNQPALAHTQGSVNALFTDGKEFITEKELKVGAYQYIAGMFAPSDTDGNGKLTRDEAETYLRLQHEATTLAVTVAYSSRMPNLFQLLDANSDGRLGVRELRTAWDRLIARQPGGGDAVTRDVLRPTAVLRIGQGNAVISDQALYNNRVIANGGVIATPTKGPVWFRKMDRNADGDVSRTEFLGSLETFAQLDHDGDGLLSLAEAEAESVSKK